MGETTEIAWTDSTWNPWWGCTKIPGPDGLPSACDHCYAARDAARYGFDVWGKDTARRMLSEANWRKPRKWNETARISGRPQLVFCASMGDVFEPRDDLNESRARLWTLIEETPHLIWQLLTKRPEWVRGMVPPSWLDGSWPSSAWIGTTVEDDARARIRIPRLVQIPAPVRFLSVEPMFGPVTLEQWLHLEWMDALRMPGAPPSFRTDDGEGGWGCEMFATLAGKTPELQWVIIGGESGARRTPLNDDHVRDLINQCDAAEIPVFFKQDSGVRSGTWHPEFSERRAFPAAAMR